jgi:hypothetical protein
VSGRSRFGCLCFQSGKQKRVPRRYDAPNSPQTASLIVQVTGERVELERELAELLANVAAAGKVIGGAQLAAEAELRAEAVAQAEQFREEEQTLWVETVKALKAVTGCFEKLHAHQLAVAATRPSAYTRWRGSIRCLADADDVPSVRFHAGRCRRAWRVRGADCRQRRRASENRAGLLRAACGAVGRHQHAPRTSEAVTRFQRRCASYGGVAQLAVEQATRTGRPTYNCPACGVPNGVQLPTVTLERPALALAPDADEIARRDRELREARAESDLWRERITW